MADTVNNLARTTASNIGLLLVDSDVKSLGQMEEALADLDLPIIKADNSSAAFKHAEDDFFLIIINIKLDEKSGIDIIDEMRKHKPNKLTPVIFLASEEEEDSYTASAYESGAVDFLRKPVDPLVLRSKVNFFWEMDKQKHELDMVIKKLGQTNQDLEQFAYIASHDLKAPLRAISNLTSWIEEDLQEVMTEDTQGYMDTLKNRIARMEGLITGLLNYARVGNKEYHNSQVDVGKLLSDVRGMMSPPEGFTISIADNMPEFETPEPPFQQVFMNLIGNAIKHHDNPSQGLIHIACEDDGDFYKFIIDDNGPGIPENLRERAFQMFQTLKSQDQVEGSGMGLALVLKIINRYDGEIFLDESPEGGARFSFSWPKSIKTMPISENENSDN